MANKVLTLDGDRLPANAKLSDYADQLPAMVRVRGLRSGQALTFDLGLDGAVDGKYTFPDAPWRWKSPSGVEAVHAALLAVTDCDGGEIHFTQKSEVQNSRGRGIAVSRCRGLELFDPWVRGARTAGIAYQDCEGVKVWRPVTIDTGNYRGPRDVGSIEEFNVAGSIKFDKCQGYELYEPISLDHTGNGITATESEGGYWDLPVTINVKGANQYINASPRHGVSGGIVVGSLTHRPNGYVINSEEENEGASELANLSGCYTLDAGQAFGVWGNEEKLVTINDLAVTDGLFVADESAPKLHPRTTIKKLLTVGTVYLTPAALDEGLLAAARKRAAELTAAVRQHDDWEKIAAERGRLTAALDALRPAKAPVVDRAALLALLVEAEPWPAQISAWLECVKKAAG